MNDMTRRLKRFYILSILQFSLVLTGFMPVSLMAETKAANTSLNAFSLMSVLNMVMGLVVVVALILGLAWILKKYGRLPNQNLAEMKILGGLSLGTREKAILIEVENTRLLVGVTPGHIQTLHVLGAKPDDTASKPAGSASFEQVLVAETTKGQPDEPV